MIRFLLTLVVACGLAACSTTTTIESKPPEAPGKADALRRAQVHTDLAAEYYRLANYKPAIAAAEVAISAEPSYAPAHNVLGLIYMALGQDDKARAAFEKAVSAAPNDSESLNNYGMFLCQRQDAKRAMEYFQRALSNPLYPTPEKALYNAGMCAKAAHDNSGAEEYFRNAIRRQPQFALPYFELADMEYQRNRFREADGHFQNYAILVPMPPVEALYLGARIARANNDRNAEAGYVLQLRRRFPDAPQTRLIIDR